MHNSDFAAVLHVLVKDLRVQKSQLNAIQDEITKCYEDLREIEASGIELTRVEKLQLIHPLLNHAEGSSRNIIEDIVANAPLQWIYAIVEQVMAKFGISSEASRNRSRQDEINSDLTAITQKVGEFAASYEKQLQDERLEFDRRETQLNEEMQRILRLKEQEHIDEINRIRDAARAEFQEHERIKMVQEQGLQNVQLAQQIRLKLQSLVDHLDNVVKQQHRRFIAALFQGKGTEWPSSRLRQEQKAYDKVLHDFAIVAEKSFHWARDFNFIFSTFQLINAKITLLVGELHNIRKVPTDGGRFIDVLFEELCTQIYAAGGQIGPTQESPVRRYNETLGAAFKTQTNGKNLHSSCETDSIWLPRPCVNKPDQTTLLTIDPL